MLKFYSYSSLPAPFQVIVILLEEMENMEGSPGDFSTTLVQDNKESRRAWFMLYQEGLVYVFPRYYFFSFHN